MQKTMQQVMCCRTSTASSTAMRTGMPRESQQASQHTAGAWCCFCWDTCSTTPLWWWGVSCSCACAARHVQDRLSLACSQMLHQQQCSTACSVTAQRLHLGMLPAVVLRSPHVCPAGSLCCVPAARSTLAVPAHVQRAAGTHLWAGPSPAAGAWQQRTHR